MADGIAPSGFIFYTPKNGTNKNDKNTRFSLSAHDTFGGSGVNVISIQLPQPSQSSFNVSRMKYVAIISSRVNLSQRISLISRYNRSLFV